MTTIIYAPLFKADSTGRLRTWWMERDGARYRTISGLVDGEKVTTEWTVATGTNVGKANERSPEEQAHSEIVSTYTKKQAQGGYVTDRSAAYDQRAFFEPMLAKKFDDWTDRTRQIRDERVFSQPKLDGIRCIIREDGMWSRQGKAIVSAPHIFESLAPLFARDPNLILDGELYTDKFANDFNAIVSLVRKQKPTANDLAASKNVIEYHIYDLPSLQANFKLRHGALVSLFDVKSNVMSKHCRLVQTTQVNSEDHLDELYAEYVECGYEGQIVRLATECYENKRSKQLLKRKEFIDEEFPIVAVEEGVGNRSGMAGRVVCKLPDGRTFGAGIVGGVDRYIKMLNDADRLVGKPCTIKFFNYTPDGMPRFPKAWAIRDYE